MNKGRYIVIEGAEGVGKTTQVQELARRLRIAGLPVRVLREPDSQTDLTARTIRQITQDPNYPMNSRTEVLLYNAARSQSLENIKDSIENGVICIVDRNYLTTLAIQYYGRGDIPNYSTINTIIDFAVGNIQPDICIVLDAPVNILRTRLSHRNSGERFDDLDEAFLERVRAGYLWEAKQRNFPVVFSSDNLEDTANNIWNLVAENLANKNHQNTAHNISSVGEIINNKQVTNELPNIVDQETDIDHDAELLILSNGKHKITAAGNNYLKSIITDNEGDVYAFTDSLSPVTIAAAMARLSRRGDDMRITLLDEFINKKEKDQDLLERVITAYGDDSVQQLAGIHLVVENASNILTKKLEWGRLSSYLEQSTRYIYFDEKDKSGSYRYFVPEINEAIKHEYIACMDAIFDIYSEIVHKLTEYIRKSSNTPIEEQDGAWKSATKAQACDAARGLLPVSTKSTVGIFASAQAVENLVMRLLSDDLYESQIVGKKILKQARKVMPVFFQRADKPERGGAYSAYMASTRQSVRKLSKDILQQPNSASNSEVELVDFWPKNEMLLVPDMLYEHSNLALHEIQEEVNSLPYEKRLKVFKSYIGDRYNRRHKPGRALEKAHYTWDILCDYGSFRDLQRHRMVDDLQWQELTPRYGYDVPEIIEEANLSEQYQEAFDISLKLHSKLVSSGYDSEAQYATLLGHKIRWKFTYNAREAFHFNELRTTPQGHPNYRKLVLKMHEKISEVHPLIAESMIFVNKDEDHELTRLAAEKYSQFKLNQIKNKA